MIPVSCGKDGNPTGPQLPVTTGALEVSVITAGPSKDTNGYTVSVDGLTQTADSTDTILFEDLEEGTHSVGLQDIQSNCAVDGDSSRMATILAEDTVSVAFDITCRKRLAGKIVFASNRGGGFEDLELYSMNPDGSNPTPLTNNGFVNIYPAISPDGTQILYSQVPTFDAINYQLRVMDADGTYDRALFSGTGINVGGSWSPDGSQILFNSTRNGNYEIYISDADGSNPVNITRSESSDQTPSWSPDGSKIAFSSNRDGDFEIFVANTDGTGLVKLTDNTSLDQFPSWSPDGTKICFIKIVNGSDPEMYFINPDGTDLVQITNNFDVGASRPAWSPDGTEIVFESNRDDNAEIYKIRVDGSGLPVNLTANPANEGYAAWSPVQQ